MAIRKLEELKVWQEARKLRQMVYEMVKTFPKEEKYNLSKHLKECARNVPGNIAEGFGRYHFQESIQFYRIARGSLNEIKSDIYCAFDETYIDETKLKEAIGQVELVAKMLNGIISSTKNLKKNP
jgi:four helix bundle protein